MGLYLAKRITRPVQMLSAAAREIGAGRLEHRIEHQADDEFGHMVESFNAMAADLSTRQRRLERASLDLEQRHQAVERRHRSVETILERIATGVISIDAAGAVGRVNSAAARLLGLPPGVEGRPIAQVLGPDLTAVMAVLDDAARARIGVGGAGGQHHARGPRGARWRWRPRDCTATAGFEGTVLVLDDVTPLIRAQKVAAWREVARRLAHEIKNPLTPIQLSAERLQRKLGEAGAPHEALVRECTSTIIGEVESLKGLVDEFSQFARMPAPKAVPSSLNQAVTDALTLYQGLFPQLTLDVALAADLPPVRLDAEQIKRVIINLVDNAVEAMDRQGAHRRRDRRTTRCTRWRGSSWPTTARASPPAIATSCSCRTTRPRAAAAGLGLAIVRRIVAEHGGNVEVSDNSPTGSRFTIELPC